MELNSNERLDMLEVMYALDLEGFHDFISHELEEQVNNDDLIYSVVCALSLAPRSFEGILIKFDFLNIIKERSEEASINIRELLPLLDQMWRYEEAEISNYSLKKVNHLKQLLQTSFHDIVGKCHNIRSYLNAEVQTALDIYKSLIASVDQALREINYLFLRGSYEPVYKRLRAKLEHLRSLKANALKILDAVESAASKKDFAEVILESIQDILDSVFTSTGIIELLRSEFRVDIKMETAAIFIPRLEAKGISIEHAVSKDSCLVFCTKIDLMDILNNIQENIILHAQASKVLIEISKQSRQFEDLLVIQIFDDGKSTDEISVGHGVNKCISVTRAYSGNFTIGRITEKHDKYIKGYRTCVSFELHDLSQEMLNKPNYAS